MIKTVQVDSANVVELIRAQMSEASDTAKGLMPSNSLRFRRGITDANLATSSGMYYGLNINTPADYTLYCVITFNISTADILVIKQLAFPTPSYSIDGSYNRMYIRYKVPAGWSAWKEL